MWPFKRRTPPLSAETKARLDDGLHRLQALGLVYILGKTKKGYKLGVAPSVGFSMWLGNIPSARMISYMVDHVDELEERLAKPTGKSYADMVEELARTYEQETQERQS